jgi:hypothetical protein
MRHCHRHRHCRQNTQKMKKHGKKGGGTKRKRSSPSPLRENEETLTHLFSRRRSPKVKEIIEDFDLIPEELRKEREELEEGEKMLFDEINKSASDFKREFKVVNKKEIKVLRTTAEKKNDMHVVNSINSYLSEHDRMMRLLIILTEELIRINEKILEEKYTEHPEDYDPNILHVLVVAHGKVINQKGEYEEKLFIVPKNITIHYEANLGHVASGISNRNKYGVAFNKKNKKMNTDNIYYPNMIALDTKLAYPDSDFDVNGIAFYNENNKTIEKMETFSEFFGKGRGKEKKFPFVSEIAIELSQKYPNKEIDLHITCCRFTWNNTPEKKR